MSVTSFFPATSTRQLTSRLQVGIDFGTQSCKLAVADLRGSQTVITSVSRFELPAGDPIKSGYLREKLQAWMWEQGLEPQEFACTLPSACTEYKCVELPPHAPSEQARLVQQTLHDHCGANEQELACDSWLTTSTSQPAITSLHITWTNPTFLNLLHGECQASGLQCRVIDAQPFVLTRIARMTTNAPHGSLVLDLGASSATLAWVQQSQPRYVRRVRSLAMAPLMQELANVYSLSSGELECLLREMKSLSPLFETQLTPWLQTLLLEITRTLNYLKQRGECTGPTAIVLCGGGSSVRGLTEYLASRIDGEVRTAELSSAVRWAAPLAYEPAFAGAIALAALGEAS